MNCQTLFSGKKNQNKRTMMVLYRSPVQTDLHTSYLSFSLVHCSKIFVLTLYGHVFLMHHDERNIPAKLY